ncbi:MAG: hypothetical protein LBU32_33260 [Clostridiales bacterium]|nr:hypothetical protein [Clostridiales bacterium]
MFKFKLYFEDITKDELEWLIFCLDLFGKGRHRIGKGRTIGMGTARIDANTVTLRKYLLQGGGVKVTDVPYKPSGQLPAAIKDAAARILELYNAVA